MPRGRTALVGVLGAFALGLGGARAADAPGGRADDDPLAAAKKDFEKAKAERASGGQGKAGLPRIDLPELPTPLITSPAASNSQRKKQAGLPEKKSANWLLEAMEKPETREARTKGDTARGARDSLSDAANTETASEANADPLQALARESARDTRAETKERAEANEPRRTEPAPNPLARYMGDWMTPQDYALLKPVVDGARPGEAPTTTNSGASGSGSGAPAVGITSALPGDFAGAGDMRGASRGGFTAPSAQENPYLQLLNTPQSAPAPVTPIAPVVATASPPPASPPPPTMETAKSRIPDFAKPLDDQKHFKQLKRF